MKHAALCAVILAPVIVLAEHRQTRVDALQFFSSSAPQEIYIETGTDEILLFNAAGGVDYCLNGRALEISAAVVEVIGEARIRAFCGSEGKGPAQVQIPQSPPAKPKAPGGCGDYGVHGCPGAPGDPGVEGYVGHPGADARKITFLAGKIIGSGELRIDSGGAEGGNGGRGAAGGNGGEGGNGKDRTCQTVCGNAGNGGACGTGGTGGVGGVGGNGADLEYSKNLSSVVGQRLFLAAGGGVGGWGGAGGPRGIPGSPGGAGGGNACGGGCSGGEQFGACSAANDGRSRETEKGAAGLPGKVLQVDLR